MEGEGITTTSEIDTVEGCSFTVAGPSPSTYSSMSRAGRNLDHWGLLVVGSLSFFYPPLVFPPHAPPWHPMLLAARFGVSRIPTGEGRQMDVIE